MRGTVTDQRQLVRLKRTLLAAGTSLLVILLMSFYWQQDYLSTKTFAWASGAILFFIAAFFTMFITGLNQRFRDPSLTMMQVLSAVAVLIFVNLNLEGGRGAFLLVYIMAVMFAVFRLTSRELLLVIAPILIVHAYALVVQLRRGLPPAEVHVEVLQYVVLAVVLLWFTQLGGYLSNLRRGLRSLSLTDELTGIYNRRHVLDMLTVEKARTDRYGGTFSVALFDVDRFKDVNDRHGHPLGDRVLVKLTQIVKAEIRVCDCFGRYGGEEFMLLFPQTNATGAMVVAERLRVRVSEYDWKSLAADMSVTISIGIDEYSKQRSADEMLRRADGALYAAKDRGRNQVVAAPTAEPAYVMQS